MSESLRDQLLKAGFSQSKQDINKKNSEKPKDKRVEKKTSAPERVMRASPGSKSNQHQRYRSAPAKKPDQHTPASRSRKVKKAPAIKPRSGTWSTKSSAGSSSPDRSLTGTNATGAATEETDTSTASTTDHDAIEKLIKDNAIKSQDGEQVYRFTMKNRISEVHINESTRTRLAESSLGVASLNGALHVVPAAIVRSIRDINAQWDVFLASDAQSQDGSSNTGNSSSGYDDFPVPDDLIW